ncbi:MAG: tRNA (5-methylaminomethyl-2-thiouridine)(34)-methyltransferase MnmD [Bacteroidales bacterium]|nr:tRNA (5-methylaminomethyl-2-thiouridine)(34)-methyltransferase MnmD [Bacteroidales bacterium]
MSHVIQQTLDGSHTIYIPELDEHYHSTNGAVQEARHIYISKAYNFSTVQNPVVFEVGFGTGLNALLTALEAERTRRKTLYVAIEKYPVSHDEWSVLNYPHIIGENSVSLFSALHLAEWDRVVEVSPYFSLKKIHADITDFLEIPMTDVIYFDAFAPNKQASMWSTEIFNFLFEHTSPNGVLTTYCAKGDVRRMLQSVGYAVERTDGPPGKREMLRAGKKIMLNV